MIRDEDVIKSNTSKYMKTHEKVLYILSLVLGIAGIITGAVLLIVGMPIWGWILLIGGIIETIGVGVLLWTEGARRNNKSKADTIDFSH